MNRFQHIRVSVCRAVCEFLRIEYYLHAGGYEKTNSGYVTDHIKRLIKAENLIEYVDKFAQGVDQHIIDGEDKNLVFANIHARAAFFIAKWRELRNYYNVGYKPPEYDKAPTQGVVVKGEIREDINDE